MTRASEPAMGYLKTGTLPFYFLYLLVSFVGQRVIRAKMGNQCKLGTQLVRSANGLTLEMSDIGIPL